ncbi:MAG TPA: glutamate--tRNA ligase [Armatimonadota bacterium]|jgi:glutamyl-tRNA synthetase
MKARTRYAPSPTGPQHIGGLRTALYSWLLARQTGGQFLLRLEDTDRERYDAESERSIKNSLRWLGLDWDEGPEVGGPHAPYTQSERLPIYQEAAERLIAQGNAYRCYCTKQRLDEMRAAQQAAKLPTGYDRKCRNLTAEERAANEAAGLPSVVRFAMPADGSVTFTDAIRGDITFENGLLDDFVILKSDGYPTYQLAAPLDDVLMEITHIIRGEEWISSATKNILLTRALGHEPPIYAHLPLILGPDKKKLSKRNGDAAVKDYQDAGYLPEVLLNFIALLGWSEGTDQELYTREELISKFSLENVTNHPAVFDVVKLDWMNGLAIRAMSLSELAKRCVPYLQAAGLIPDPVPAEMLAYIESVIALEQERLHKLADAPEMTAFFFKHDLEWDDKALKKVQADGAKEILSAAADALEATADWSFESVESAVRGLIETRGVKPGEVIHPVRAAVTGRTVGPGLFETIHVLGKAETIRRLRNAS